jgi:hypothetical protein
MCIKLGVETGFIDNSEERRILVKHRSVSEAHRLEAYATLIFRTVVRFIGTTPGAIAVSNTILIGNGRSIAGSRGAYSGKVKCPSPCRGNHRVINHGGSVGGFAGKWNRKPGLLDLEKRLTAKNESRIQESGARIQNRTGPGRGLGTLPLSGLHCKRDSPSASCL